MARSRKRKRGRATLLGDRALRLIRSLQFEVGFWRTRAKLIPLEMQRMYARSDKAKRKRRPETQRVTDAKIRSAWRSTNTEKPRNRVTATLKKLELTGVTISKQGLRKRLHRFGFLQKTT